VEPFKEAARKTLVGMTIERIPVMIELRRKKGATKSGENEPSHLSEREVTSRNPIHRTTETALLFPIAL
jgi:hypothetical protein